MNPFADLSPEELGSQLRDPTGDLGIAVAEALREVNEDGMRLGLSLAAIEPDMVVLEEGCGLGDIVPAILSLGEGIRYVGLDRSDTMIKGARRRYGEPIEEGRARFELGSSEQLPFSDASFDRVLSIGLIHFWPDPAAALEEVARVLVPGGRMVMLGLGPERAAPFMLAENGFHLRTGQDWEHLCRAAGLTPLQIAPIDIPGSPQGMMVCAIR